MIAVETRKPEPSPKRAREISSIAGFLGKMVHIVAIGLPLFVIWLAQPGSNLFSWHPTLMVLAFCFLMVEAILMFSPHSSLIQTMPRATKALWHWLIQVVAILSAIIGFVVIVYNKYTRGKNHFTTWHGTFGLVTIILISIQAFQGLSVLYPKFALLSKKLGERKQLHALFGSVVFTVSIATVILGFFSNWFVRNTNELTWWGSVLSAFALAGIVMGQVVNEYGVRKKT